MNAKKQARRAAALARLTIMTRDEWSTARICASSDARFNRHDAHMIANYGLTSDAYDAAYAGYVARKEQERAALGG